VISAFVTLHFHWTFAALLPATFLVITGIGYSLIIGGMTLLWKRIQLLQECVLMLVMVFAFVALPVFTVPGWFAGLGRVFPLTSRYGVMLGHRGVTGAWGTGGLAWLIGRRRLPRGRHPHLHRAGARHQGARHTRRLLMPLSPTTMWSKPQAMFPAEIQAMVSFMRVILHERQSERPASRSQAEDHPSPCPAFQPPDTGRNRSRTRLGICPGGMGFGTHRCHPEVQGTGLDLV
jgi:hypothetical protein